MPGEVPQSVTTIRINLFGKQAQVVAIVQQLLEVVVRLLQRPSAKRQVLGGPEAADTKRSFGRLALIAKQQAMIPTKLIAHLTVRALHALGMRFLETVPGKTQQCGVNFVSIQSTDVTLLAVRSRREARSAAGCVLAHE